MFVYTQYAVLLKIKLNLLVKFIGNIWQHALGSPSFTMQVVLLHFCLHTSENYTRNWKEQIALHDRNLALSRFKLSFKLRPWSLPNKPGWKSTELSDPSPAKYWIMHNSTDKVVPEISVELTK